MIIHFVHPLDVGCACPARADPQASCDCRVTWQGRFRLARITVELTMK